MYSIILKPVLWLGHAFCNDTCSYKKLSRDIPEEN